MPLVIAIHLVTGISTTGITLAQGNIGLKLAPRDKGVIYLATMGIINSSAARIGPLLGGTFADFFSRYVLPILFRWRTPLRDILFTTISIERWDFFLLAFLIGLYSIHRLGKLNEVPISIFRLRQDFGQG